MAKKKSIFDGMSHNNHRPGAPGTSRDHLHTGKPAGRAVKAQSKEHSRQSSSDDFLTSGVYIDHRKHDDLVLQHSAPGRSRRRATHQPQKRGSESHIQDTPGLPILPLTNQNLQNLIKGNENSPRTETGRSRLKERPYGSVALDMDQYAREQSQLAKTLALTNPFNRADQVDRLSLPHGDDDDEERLSLNSYEFGASNPSSEHSSDSTSLDDVCFPDYYDQNGPDSKDSYEWPDLKVLEEYVKEELEEFMESKDEEQVHFNVDFQKRASHKNESPENLPTSRYLGHVESNEDTPLLNNYHVNEVDSLDLMSNSLRIRPTPIQPWEKSKEQIPTILRNQNGPSNFQTKQAGKAPRYDGKLCRFTYFREDLNTTIHSPTISGLIGEDESSDEPTTVDKASDLQTTSQHDDQDDGIYSKLQELFRPIRPTSLSKSPSSASVSNVASHHENHNSSGINLNGNALEVKPLTKVVKQASKGNESPYPDGAGSVAATSEKPPNSPYWLDVLDPTEEEMKVLSKTFGIHPLTTEDIFLGETREKVELFKSYYFICFTSFDVVYERRKQRAKEQEKKLNKLQEMYENAGTGDGNDANSIFGSPEQKSKVWGFFRNWVNKKSSDTRKSTSHSYNKVPTKGSGSMKSRQKKIREGELLPLNMYMIVFKDAVITFHFSATPHPINVRRRARLLKDYLTVSSDWICYALVDDITDSFAPMIESIEVEVNSIEDAILKMHSGDSDSDDDSDLDSDLDSDVDSHYGRNINARRRKKSNENQKNTGENVFFRRKRTKSTVDHRVGSRFKNFPIRSSSSKSSSKSSRSSKTESKTIGWKRKGDMLRRIGECRKRVMSVLRLLGSKADVIRGFSKRFGEAINESRDGTKSEIGMYLGDIQDHIVTMVQSLNHYEKLLARFHSNYLAQINIDMTKVNNDTNDVLGKITILGTIVLPINVVTGLWGMNCVVPGQEYEGLAWFWCIVASMIIFSTIGYNYAKKVTGL
ncbi:cora-domain-containing protein [Suhomyces tanzawaensis NRRL Y-17324]|uniref:Cora-domain-containing protein n=1 Tax=Suhomyces tanzawaensis NRRL Y-17324 TaxID=984487 RepID=A0A1E4SDU3_9ASCO|nr:cora-domain-containing protein [Suhomyces tanzawaensis NRRL Y-17324]ODV77687.1 cora-domain-containing protein [Suhomyces tanzawaensis NRRL Y-17324]